MIEALVVILLGVIEGITEFLPISSTGHMLIAEQWLPIRESDTFLVVVQCGAAAAVLMIFQERLRQLLSGWRDAAARDYLLKLAVAFAVTGAGGLLIKRLGFQLPESATPVAVALAVGGVLFLLIERWLRGRPSAASVTWSMAAALGAAQLLAAVFPGTSRSGATILLALALGLDRATAVEFSFLLGVPTLFAAAAVQLLSYLRHPGAEHLDFGMLALGTLVAAVTAFAAVKWLLRYLRSHTFETFGWYRIALGSMLLAIALF